MQADASVWLEIIICWIFFGDVLLLHRYKLLQVDVKSQQTRTILKQTFIFITSITCTCLMYLMDAQVISLRRIQAVPLFFVSTQPTTFLCNLMPTISLKLV